MVKLLKKTTFKDFYSVNEFVARTTPMRVHYLSSNFIERWLWSKKKQVIKYYLDNLKIKRIVDIGCGDTMLIDLVNPKIDYTGVDISPTQVRYARKKIKKIGRKNAKVYKDDVLALKSLGNNKFDAALACDVAEHVLDPNKLFKKLKDATKKGGHIIICIPNEPLWQLARLFLFRFPLRSPDHLYSISAKDIEENFPNVVEKDFIPIKFSSKLSLIRVFLIKNE